MNFRIALIRMNMCLAAVTLIAFSLFSCGGETDGMRSDRDAAPFPSLSGKIMKGDKERYDSYLYSVQKLKEKYSEVIVLDARTKREYERGHLPGAVHAYWTDWSNVSVKQGEKGWADILPPEIMRVKLGSLGIDGSRPVVIYIDTLEGWGEDGRQLWTLRYYGLKNTYILNGGIKAWKDSGGDITGILPKITAVSGPELVPDASFLAVLEQLSGGTGSMKILDVREDEEFAGLKVYGEKKKGRIPGARHIWFRDFYNIDGTLQEPSQIRARVESIGFSPGDEIAVYCTGGIRSGLAAIAIRMAGYEKAKNYNAGYSEWAGTGQQVDCTVLKKLY